MFNHLNLFSELAEDETNIAELERMVTNLSRESQDKRELLESIQSDKETISKWVYKYRISFPFTICDGRVFHDEIDNLHVRLIFDLGKKKVNSHK